MADPLPWRAFTSPLDKWQTQPSFVLGEYVLIACALVTLVHALEQSGAARRRHLLVWLAALIAGSANDLIFMALPLVDNFWHGQATIMLTPRLPLYIPCVYVWFMYVPTVAVWRLGLRPLPSAALSGLLTVPVYAPFDITGAKFLWWTWHDTDPAIAHRLLGVPISSTMWSMTMVAAFAWLMGRVVSRDGEVSGKTALGGLVVAALFTTPLMVLQLTLVRQLDGGGVGALGAVVVLYAALAARGWKTRAPAAPRRYDRVLLGAVVGYLAALVVVVALFRPETHQSTGVHQTVGKCYVKAADVTGALRDRFLCATDFDEDFSFDCAQRPADGARWYTICGRAHSNLPGWLAVMLALAGTGSAAYAYLLGRRK